MPVTSSRVSYWMTRAGVFVGIDRRSDTIIVFTPQIENSKLTWICEYNLKNPELTSELSLCKELITAR
jgi:hypothetical protein